MLTRLGGAVHRAISDKLATASIGDHGRRASAVLVIVDGILVDRLSAPAGCMRTWAELRAMMAAALGCD